MILRKLLLLILFALSSGFISHSRTLTRLPSIRVCNLDKGSRKGSRQVFLCVPPGSNGGDGEGGGGRGDDGKNNDDENNEESDGALNDLFIDARNQGKKAFDDLSGLLKGMGPTIQFMPRRIPSILRNPAFLQNLKIYFSQFPQLIRLTSLLGKDLLYLHSMSALAGGCSLLFNFWVRAPMVGKRVVAFPITWNGIFMTINLLQVRRLLKERRPIDFTGREAEAFEKFFEGRISARSFHTLMRDCGGKFVQFPASSALCTQGKPVENLMFLVEGSCDIFVDGNYVSSVPKESFIGEMSFLEAYHGDSKIHNNKWVPSFVPTWFRGVSKLLGFETAAASVRPTSREGCTCLSWSQDQLSKFMLSNPDFSSGFESMLAADLVKKLKATRKNRIITLPKGQRGVSKKIMRKAREGGGIRRRGVVKMRLRELLGFVGGPAVPPKSADFGFSIPQQLPVQ